MSDNNIVPQYLFDISVDFQGLNVTSAAQIYLRVLLWVTKRTRISDLSKSLIVIIAKSFHNVLGCEFRAESTSDKKERKLWLKIAGDYRKPVKAAWENLWRIIGNCIFEDGTSEEIMLKALFDTENDDLISAYCKPRLRNTERLYELPTFNLSEEAELTVFDINEIEIMSEEKLT
jgi:hypothetical protein